MNENTLNSHWENPNGPRALMKKVYYKKDVDKLLERSLVFDSWDDAFDLQAGILYRIKKNCVYAQSNKYFNDKERYEKSIKTIKSLVFLWKRLKQIRLNLKKVKNV